MCIHNVEALKYKISASTQMNSLMISTSTSDGSGRTPCTDISVYITKLPFPEPDVVEFVEVELLPELVLLATELAEGAALLAAEDRGVADADPERLDAETAGDAETEGIEPRVAQSIALVTRPFRSILYRVQMG